MILTIALLHYYTTTLLTKCIPLAGACPSAILPSARRNAYTRLPPPLPHTTRTPPNHRRCVPKRDLAIGSAECPGILTYHSAQCGGGDRHDTSDERTLKRVGVGVHVLNVGDVDLKVIFYFVVSMALLPPTFGFLKAACVYHPLPVRFVV